MDGEPQTTGPLLLVLVGPTGVGKTELSLRLAERLGVPIISADSRQMYADLKIGTAAPTPEQLARAKHYFVGNLQLSDYYSAARYEAEVLHLLPRLFAQHAVALLTGGSMMYVDAVCHGLDDIPSVDPDTRARLAQRLEAEGLDRLGEELRLLDPDYYREVDLKNPRRVVHALEVCLSTGRPYSHFRLSRPEPRPFRVLKVGLTRPRAELYDRINRRVDQMMAEGLLEEARRVYPFRQLNALNTVGYKELFAYLDGLCSLPQAVEAIKQNSRHYAKRQLTWLRRDRQTTWFLPNQEADIYACVDKAMQGQ